MKYYMVAYEEARRLSREEQIELVNNGAYRTGGHFWFVANHASREILDRYKVGNRKLYHTIHRVKLPARFEKLEVKV